MQNLYKTTYADSLGIFREVYTIAENQTRARYLAILRIQEMHKQEELWYEEAVAAGMTVRKIQEPWILNINLVMNAEEELGA